MKSFIYVTLLLLSSITYAENEYRISKITKLDISNTINPAVFNYLETHFKKLSAKKGDFILIQMNTPGGLVSTTKEILTLIGDQDIPVAVWIGPEGASATSAGAIISSSAHLLVMSEGTNIGAATPIGLGKDIEQKDARSKAVNDLSALVTSLSKARGRNADEFTKMISEAKSLDARSALKENVIDKIINNEQEFITFLDNKIIKVRGQDLKLSLSPQVKINEASMDIGQLLLNILANPNTAYILFIIGAALIYFEFQAPGGFVAGAIGAVFLGLAAIGFQVLPLNVGAMGLILLSFILFIVEAYVTSFGLITIAGIASLIFGSLFLFRTENSLVQIETSIIISVVASIVIYVGFIGWFFLKTKRVEKEFNSMTEHEGHITKFLEYKDGLYHYQVRVHGETWNAYSKNELDNDKAIIVIKTDNDEMQLEIKQA